MRPPAFTRLSSRQTLSKVRTALAGAVGAAPFDADALTPAALDLVVRLPDWVGRFGSLQGGGRFVLWCGPRAGAGETFPSQIVLALPAGRYFVEALDAAAGTWISRESCAGGPLVAGLPFTGGAVLVLVRPARV